MQNTEKELNDTELKMYQFITNQKPNTIYNIESEVGVGKIQMLKNIAEKMNVRFIIFQMSMCELSDISNIDLFLNEPTLIIFEDIDRIKTFIQEKLLDVIIRRKTPNGLDIGFDIHMVCCSRYDINGDYVNNPITNNPYMITLTI